MTSFMRVIRCFNVTCRHIVANQPAHRFARFDRFTVDAMPQKGCLWKNFFDQCRTDTASRFALRASCGWLKFFPARQTKSCTDKMHGNADVIWVFVESKFCFAWLDAAREFAVFAAALRFTTQA